MKWRNLLMPKELVRDDATATPTNARFIVEPLDQRIYLGHQLWSGLCHVSSLVRSPILPLLD